MRSGNPGTIVLLHRSGAQARGIEVVFLQSVKALAAAGHRLIVCRNDACIDDTLKAITPRPQIMEFRFPEMMIDGIKGTSFPILSYINAFKRLKTLVRNHGATLLYSSGGLPCQLALPVARLCGIPLIGHIHHPATKRERYLWLAIFADELIFPSAFTRRHMLSSRDGCGRVVYNGIDLTRFHPTRDKEPKWRSQLGIPADATVIGQAAALVPYKRADLLMSAFNALRNATRKPLHLCLVGGGPLKERLRRQASELGILQHVTLTGRVDNTVPYYRHVFDINVLASRNEGFGLSAIEGSACGLPAVVSSCGGLPETILENRTGLLFDTNDGGSLQRQLLRLVDNPALRASMGSAGVAFVGQRFSIDSYEQNFTAAVADVFHRSPQPA